MKFVALVKKEFRESLPFIIAAGIFLLVLGWLCLKITSEHRSYGWFYEDFEQGTSVDAHQLRRYSCLNCVGPWVFILSAALGVAIGVRQFWVAFYSRTWDFEICRPVKRGTVLAAKLTVCIMGFLISVGLVWLLLYWYASRQGVWFIPPTSRVLVEGLDYNRSWLCNLSRRSCGGSEYGEMVHD